MNKRKATEIIAYAVVIALGIAAIGLSLAMNVAIWKTIFGLF